MVHPANMRLRLSRSSRDYAALQDLGARHNMTEDFLAVFHAFRPEIEKRASAKFDAGERDANGNVVLTGADLNF